MNLNFIRNYSIPGQLDNEFIKDRIAESIVKLGYRSDKLDKYVEIHRKVHSFMKREVLNPIQKGKVFSWTDNSKQRIELKVNLAPFLLRMFFVALIASLIFGVTVGFLIDWIIISFLIFFLIAIMIGRILIGKFVSRFFSETYKNITCYNNTSA